MVSDKYGATACYIKRYCSYIKRQIDNGWRVKMGQAFCCQGCAERTLEIGHMASGESIDLTLAVKYADRIGGFSPRLGRSHY